MLIRGQSFEKPFESMNPRFCAHLTPSKATLLHAKDNFIVIMSNHNQCKQFTSDGLPTGGGSPQGSCACCGEPASSSRSHGIDTLSGVEMKNMSLFSSANHGGAQALWKAKQS